MIANNWPARRIAVTGSTGFLGTALVERLMRAVPDCELVLLVRPGKRSTPDPTGSPRDLPQQRLRPPARRARQGRVLGRGRPTGHRHRRRRRHRRPRSRRRGSPALSPRCDIVIHSAATVSFDAPIDHGGRGQPARPHPHRRDPPRPGRRLRTSSPCRPATSPATVGARHPSNCSPTARSTSTSTGEPRSPPPVGPAPTSMPRAALPNVSTSSAAMPADETRRCRHPAARRQDRTDAPALGVGATGRGRPCPCRLARLARRLRLHQGPRRASPRSNPRATFRSRSFARRSSSRPGPSPCPGWIKGFRMAEPILISYAQGLLKEFPGVPEGVVDVIPVDLVVAAIINVAARGPEIIRCTPSTSPRSPRAPATRCSYRQLVELVSGWFTENPLYDRKGQPIAVARIVVPRPRRRRTSARPGATQPRSGRQGAQTVAPPRQAGHDQRRRRRQEGTGRSGHRLREDLRRLRRVRGPLRRRRPRRSARLARRSRSGPVLLRPCSRSTGTHYVTAGPPALGRRARSGQDQAASASDPDARTKRLRSRVLDTRAPARCVRPREHDHRLERGLQLCLAGHPRPGADATGCGSRSRPCPRHPSCWRSTSATAPTSSATSIAATTVHRSPRWNGSARNSWPTTSSPRRFPLRSAEFANTGAWGTAPCSSPAPSTSWSTRFGRCSTT